MSADKLTVCMPIYNGSEYLAESIASLLDQTYSDFHLIICDDCSTDGSDRIVRSFQDPRITYIRNPRRLGLVGNFNKCVSLNTSEYLYLWHQDDVMMRENLRKKVELLDAHPSVGFVHSNVEWWEELTQQVYGRKHYTGFEEDSNRDYVVPGYFFFLRNLNANMVICPSAMMRAKCYTKLGGYREELPYACDYEFSLRVSLYYDVAWIRESLIRYRRHATNESQNFAKVAAASEQEALARRIILTEHGHRLPDPELAASIMAHTVARDGIRAATRALSDPPTSTAEFLIAWRHLCRAVRSRPGLLARQEPWWVLQRLLLGPVGLRMVRRAKHWLVRKPPQSASPLAGLPR